MQKNLSKKKLVFLTDNIFNLRDYKRYGVSYLKKKFDVKIYTFNKNYLKKKNIYYFKSYFLMKNIINSEKPDFVIDLMFPSLKSYLIKKKFKNLKVKLIKLNLSTYPIEKINLKKKILNFFNKNKKYGGNIFTKLKNHLMIKLNSLILYDYYFIDGRINDLKKKKCKVIKNHSLDYDIFLLNKKNAKKKLIVFLDSNVISHSDYNIHSTKNPVNKKKYLNDMNDFFNKVEKKFNQKIVVAANPKSRLSEIRKNFKNRKVYINNTFNLVKDAKFVMTHKSTAVSFVLSLKKPIIFLTSDELDITWYGDQIKYQSELLGSKLININSSNADILKKNININKKKYNKYFFNYIKYPKTKYVYNWKLFLKEIY